MRRLPNSIVAFIVAGGLLLGSAAIVKLAEYVHNNAWAQDALGWAIVFATVYGFTYWIVSLMRMDG